MAETEQSMKMVVANAMPSFTRSEKQAARVLLAHYPMIGLESITGFAKAANVSAATIQRLVQKLGCDGYPEFRQKLRDEIAKSHESPLTLYRSDEKVPAATALRNSLVTALERTLDAVERAFARLAEGDVVMPPVLSMQIAAATGKVDIKTAYVPGLTQFAVKISPGFFDNPTIGLPSLNGMMVALSAKTGIAKAVLLDNGYLTNVRTAGAVAARRLAAEDTRTLGIIGAGIQARLQAQAVAKVRPIEEILIWGRHGRARRHRACHAAG